MGSQPICATADSCYPSPVRMRNIDGSHGVEVHEDDTRGSAAATYKAVQNARLLHQLSPPTPHQHRSTTDTVRAEIHESMRFHTFVDTPNMVDTFFPKDSPLLAPVVAHVFKQIKKRRIWRPKDKSWKSLPKKPKHESELYTPLTAIMNAITQIAVEFCNTQADGSSCSIAWSDEHNKNIPSRFSLDIRPDIVASFMKATWWRLLQAILEVKKSSYITAASVVQLLQYIRTALKEQVDRRFMFGMMFGKRDLSVWLVDRSGAMGSKPFNIHEDPEQFIRIIVGLILLPRSDLGWDPTMQIYFPPQTPGHGEYGWGRYSYEVEEDTNLSPTFSTYRRMWLVTMDKPKSNTSASNNDEEKFVLYHALSLARAEVLRGRATRIWLAWKFTDMDRLAKERKTYVFKDVWRDERRGLEGELYAKAFVGRNSGDGVAQVHSFSTVHIDGRVDDTLNLIRKKVPVQGNAIRLLPKRVASEKRAEQLTHDMYLFQDHIHEWSQDMYDLEEEDYCSPYNRIHSRLVMSTFGWPVKYYKSLPELMGVMRDAIAGHQFIFQKGVLHRDISYGNILIVPDGHIGSRGVLIDFDFAINWEDHKRLKGDERSGTLAFMSAEVLLEKRYFKPDFDDGIANPDSDNPSPSTTITATESPPEETMFPRSGGIKHQPIHDLESFFWVLCWLCIFRDGPAHERQNWGETEDERKSIRRDTLSIFENTIIAEIANTKRDLIDEPSTFRSALPDIFTPFCAPLRSVAGIFYQTLRRAYKSSADLPAYPTEDVYAQVIKIFDDALTRPAILNHNATNPEYLAREAAETQRRETQLEIWATPLPDKKRKHTEDEGQAASSSTSTHHPPIVPDGSPARKTRRSNQQSREENAPSHGSKGRKKGPVPSAASTQNATPGPSNVPKSPSRKARRSARSASDKSTSSPISSPSKAASVRTPEKKRRS